MRNHILCLKLIDSDLFFRFEFRKTVFKKMNAIIFKIPPPKIILKTKIGLIFELFEQVFEPIRSKNDKCHNFPRNLKKIKFSYYDEESRFLFKLGQSEILFLFRIPRNFIKKTK